MKELNPILASSADPTELSLTVKGLLVIFVPIAMAVLRITGYTVPDTDTTALIDATANVVSVGATFVSAIMIFYGLARKLVHAFTD
jgi:hypothetical protein